jgi:hypothetical protein
MPTPQEDYRIIPLTQGQVAKVSAEDYEWLNRWKWYAKNSKSGFYAARNARSGNGQTTIRMHSIIMGARCGECVDHVNHDTLDNRRNNLRIATHQENHRNQKTRSDNQTGYKGVTRHRNFFRARIVINGTKIYLGERRTAAEAHELYRDASETRFGGFSHADTPL